MTAMENFTYYNPTRIHFGRGQIAKISQELPPQARVLLLAGGGSIKQNGVYDQVRAALGAPALTAPVPAPGPRSACGGP